MQLKRWESPRRKGRNAKGKGGAARQRQKKKQLQMLRKKLKNQTGKGGLIPSLVFWRNLENTSLACAKTYNQTDIDGEIHRS